MTVLLEGCCSNCEKRRNPVPPATIPNIRISDPFYGRTQLSKEIEQAVREALECWRKQVWTEEWADSNIDPSFLMTDKILQAIARAAENVQHVEDFKQLKPPFQLWPRYGEAVFVTLSTARERVLARYQARQAVVVQRQQEQNARRAKAGKGVFKCEEDAEEREEPAEEA